MIRFILVLPLFLFLSCKSDVPREIIKQEQMQQILWDIFRADAFARQIVSGDSSRSQADENAKLTDKVFLMHNVTREQFEKSYTYYTQHPDIMKTMLDSINVQQERKNNWEMTHREKSLTDSTKPPVQ